jgi:hypothetical protein
MHEVEKMLNKLAPGTIALIGQSTLIMGSTLKQTAAAASFHILPCSPVSLFFVSVP